MKNPIFFMPFILSFHDSRIQHRSCTKNSNCHRCDKMPYVVNIEFWKPHKHRGDMLSEANKAFIAVGLVSQNIFFGAKEWAWSIHFLSGYSNHQEISWQAGSKWSAERVETAEKLRRWNQRLITKSFGDWSTTQLPLRIGDSTRLFLFRHRWR